MSSPNPRRKKVNIHRKKWDLHRLREQTNIHLAISDHLLHVRRMVRHIIVADIEDRAQVAMDRKIRFSNRNKSRKCWSCSKSITRNDGRN
jgi:hypothetical protein